MKRGCPSFIEFTRILSFPLPPVRLLNYCNPWFPKRSLPYQRLIKDWSAHFIGQDYVRFFSEGPKGFYLKLGDVMNDQGTHVAFSTVISLRAKTLKIFKELETIKQLGRRLFWSAVNVGSYSLNECPMHGSNFMSKDQTLLIFGPHIVPKEGTRFKA
ncbi:hypothetical protein QJS10_CPB18g00598 [Acorus calamus]|uniref:Uncharacterized protein n=1 Tax=Acorus calamus TaxID=4465 RepID=A0AAV9CLQ2_ACOCL|nr:hypothetical protein QJS10_CPB18g00598 [Acorus calamus]